MADGVRVYRTIAEERRIVALTLQRGQSVARVAQAKGAKSHQVFHWRQLYRQGRLVEFLSSPNALLPVVISKSKTHRERREGEARSSNQFRSTIRSTKCEVLDDLGGFRRSPTGLQVVEKPQTARLSSFSAPAWIAMMPSPLRVIPAVLHSNPVRLYSTVDGSDAE